MNLFHKFIRLDSFRFDVYSNTTSSLCNLWNNGVWIQICTPFIYLALMLVTQFAVEPIILWNVDFGFFFWRWWFIKYSLLYLIHVVFWCCVMLSLFQFSVASSSSSYWPRELNWRMFSSNRKCSSTKFLCHPWINVFCYPKFHVLGSNVFSSVILYLLLACGKSTLTGELVFDWIKFHFNVIDMLVHVFCPRV